ncbi:MAG: hypothetical protein U9N56_08540 [Actinomycetota bacterium]|nr:hypothetical protein [Actinomycetota bacterium]
MSVNRVRAGLVLALTAVLVLAACSDEPVQELEPPAHNVPIEGTDRYRVVLTPKAAVRLDIQSLQVAETDLGPAVSSDALILDPDGRFWVYVIPEPLQYERVELVSVRDEGGQAYFDEGPTVGTDVVVVGVPELYGEETGVGK